MSLVTAIFVMSIFIILGEIFLLIREKIEQKKYAKILKREQTRKRFANFRRRLTELSERDDLKLNSITFQTFYKLLSVFLRHQEEYREMSNVLFLVFSLDKETLDELLKEIKRRHLDDSNADELAKIRKEAQDWPAKMSDLIVEVNREMDVFVEEFSSFQINFLFKIMPVLTKLFNLFSLKRYAEYAKELSQFKEIFPKTQANLKRLVSI